MGATVEEDTGYRDMRVFQVEAPEGHVWVGDVSSIRVEWAKGNTPSARAHNAAELLCVKEAMECGYEPEPSPSNE